jgi:hypothetical protein
MIKNRRTYPTRVVANTEATEAKLPYPGTSRTVIGAGGELKKSNP